MFKPRSKPNYRRRILCLPDLDHCKTAVLNSLGSPPSRRVYEYAIDQFIAWYCSEPRLANVKESPVFGYLMLEHFYTEVFRLFQISDTSNLDEMASVCMKLADE